MPSKRLRAYLRDGGLRQQRANAQPQPQHLLRRAPASITSARFTRAVELRRPRPDAAQSERKRRAHSTVSDGGGRASEAPRTRLRHQSLDVSGPSGSKVSVCDQLRAKPASGAREGGDAKQSACLSCPLSKRRPLCLLRRSAAAGVRSRLHKAAHIDGGLYESAHRAPDPRASLSAQGRCGGLFRRATAAWRLSQVLGRGPVGAVAIGHDANPT